ncbi:MAG: peptidyl-prolyl cis-trans isomerase [Bacteroidota bacterium]|nr:peptidyl-prolyl cis-trans isomerase [Bacteroidota bacterium]
MIILILIVSSCDWTIKSTHQDAIARVNSTFLTKDKIDVGLFDGLSVQDSLIQIQNIINDWATQQLLQDGALVNLEAQKQKEFETLVKDYKRDLLTSAYLEAMTKQNLDTIISNHELELAYKQNKELFKLKEDLIKLRYINHNLNMSNSNEIKRRFKRYNAEDRAILDTISLQFNSFFLNDSVWINSNQVISKIGPLQKGFNKVLLKKQNFIQLKDSLGLYLMQVKDVLEIGQQAPLAYVTPTLKQIIINKRKLKLVNQLKSEIVNDALRNKKFEIYE